MEETVAREKISFKNGAARYSYTPDKAGSYTLRITSPDNQGREAVTDLNFYATGGQWIRWASNNSNDINMIVDQELYFPGDTARIMVQSPLEKGKYLLTVEREGILEEKIITLDSSTSVIEIPIKEDYLPVMYVSLCSFQPRDGVPSSYFEPDLGKPKGLFGAAEIRVSTEPRQLDIEMMTDNKIYRPGDEVTVVLKVTSGGVPVSGAEVTYLSVDRGVLDIINYHVPDPLTFFYDPGNFPLFTGGDDSRRLLLDPVTYDVSNLTGGDGEDSKLDRREDFSPLAVFQPFLKTDKNGLVKVTYKLPDTLTTYRSTVIALNGADLGYHENEIMVQNPINVRTALPRRMRVRDTALAGCVVHNIDSKEHTVTVSVRSDLISVAGEKEQIIKVPAGGIYEVPFILEAKKQGEAELVFTIRSDAVNEEVVSVIEVEQPVIYESFTTTGKVSSEDKEGKEEGLIIPSKIGEGYGGLSLRLDSTMIPFVEQYIYDMYYRSYSVTLTESGYKALPSLLFPDETAGTAGVSRKQIDRNVDSYFRYAASLQRSDGGFANSSESIKYSSLYTSMQVALILGLARENGYTGKVGFNEKKLFTYLRTQYGKCSVYSKAKILYLLALNGQETKSEAETLLKEADNLGISGYSFLALTFLKQGDISQAKKIYSRLKKKKN